MSLPGTSPRTPEHGPAGFGTEAFYASIGRALVALCAFVPVLYGVVVIDQLVNHRLNRTVGIQPHALYGLDGVLFAPFLHADFRHVTANSAPLILLGTFALVGGAKRFVASTAVIALVSGLGTWLVGDPRTIIIGASGVIFGYIGLLLARGVVDRSWWDTAVGVLIGLLYGWQLVALFPTDQRVSWQAHLFGFGGGILAGLLFRRRRHRRALPAGKTLALKPGPVPAGPVTAPAIDDTLSLPTERLPPG